MSLVLSIAIAVLAAPSPAEADPQALIEQAKAAFDKANYHQALDYLKAALAEAPDNPEVNYYLGFFLHYLCYDSVPLSGYGREHSDQILRYLERAIELDPSHGNAHYFLGAEYGVRAREALRAGRYDDAVAELQRAREAGGLPDWLLEYARNTLRSCDQNAILFCGGDAETNPLEFLQWVDGFRTDVTVVPVALLDRPWFAQILRNGAGSLVQPGLVDWTENQILEMRPYKWQKNDILIPVAVGVLESTDLEVAACEWTVEPDLGRGEEMVYLSAGRALLANVLQNNQYRRPVYFSMGCSPQIYQGLDKYLKTVGFTLALQPIEPADPLDVDRTVALLLDSSNFTALPTLRDHDMPRASGVLRNYQVVFLNVAAHCASHDQPDTARALLAAMKTSLPDDILPVPEGMKAYMDRLAESLNE